MKRDRTDVMLMIIYFHNLFAFYEMKIMSSFVIDIINAFIAVCTVGITVYYCI